MFDIFALGLHFLLCVEFLFSPLQPYLPHVHAWGLINFSWQGCPAGALIESADFEREGVLVYALAVAKG